MRKFFLSFSCFLFTVSYGNADSMKCNFFFKTVANEKVFVRTLFIDEGSKYEVHYSMTDHNPYFPGEPALAWETPFTGDEFYGIKVSPKLKKIGTTIVLDWNTNNVRIPTGHVTNLQFHVSIKKKKINENVHWFTAMDVMSDIEPGVGVSTSGDCKY